MTFQALRDQVNEYGTGHAIVFLSSSADAQALEDLRSIFAQGWPNLRERLASGALDHDGLTDVIKRLVEGTYASDSHMLHFPHIGVVYGAVNADVIAGLEAHAAVDDVHRAVSLGLIEPARERVIAKSPAAGATWGVQRIKAPGLWQQGLSGKGVVVAHLDTGMDATHPALAHLVARDMVFDDEGREAGPETPFRDSDEHGTHTAGTLVGRGTPREPEIGVAPGAHLACARIIKTGDTVARVLAGLDWSVGLGAKVLNLSVGFRDWNGSFEGVMKSLRAAQVLPVVAIGNWAGKTYSPGNYATVLSVGATTEDDLVAPFSSFHQSGQRGNGPLLCAPGRTILSSVPGGKYAEQDGTSSATPHVAGLAALLFEAFPAASIDQVQAAIIGSCENPKNEDRVRIGAGIPDGMKALANLRELLV